MICPVCSERLEGDGYTTPLHSPNTDPAGLEPDANPLYCKEEFLQEE